MPGYKFKNPAHWEGMRELKVKPVHDDGTVDGNAEVRSMFFDRDDTVHVAGHIPGSAGARANDKGNPRTYRYTRL